MILVTIAFAGVPAATFAQSKPWTVRAPDIRPPFATARCSDGLYWTSVQRAGACGGHGGVVEWLRPDPPKDATARCADATWSSDPDRAHACSQHGGARVFLRPRRAPNTTALCADGSWWTDPEPQNACAGRGGVSEWYGGPGGALPVKPSAPLRLGGSR